MKETKCVKTKYPNLIGRYYLDFGELDVILAFIQKYKPNIHCLVIANTLNPCYIKDDLCFNGHELVYLKSVGYVKDLAKLDIKNSIYYCNEDFWSNEENIANYVGYLVTDMFLPKDAFLENGISPHNRLSIDDYAELDCMIEKFNSLTPILSTHKQN